MKIKPLHPDFKMPTKGTEGAGAYDLYMPESGVVSAGLQVGIPIKLGFAAEVPEGHVALLLPRSGKGAKEGLSLNNTVGVIDSDYRGEFIANVRIRNPGHTLVWEKGDRLFQMLIVPVAMVNLELADELDSTERGEGGFNSTGN